MTARIQCSLKMGKEKERKREGKEKGERERKGEERELVPRGDIGLYIEPPPPPPLLRFPLHDCPFDNPPQSAPSGKLWALWELLERQKMFSVKQ